MTHAIGHVPRSARRKPTIMRLAATALVIFVTFGFIDNVRAEGDADRGRDKAYTCMGCHGAAGIRNAYPNFNVPKLAGQQAEYIVAALLAYKNKQREHPTMQANTATMTDEDMADIGAYFSQFGK